jgi:hypothetical protein
MPVDTMNVDKIAADNMPEDKMTSDNAAIEKNDCL